MRQQAWPHLLPLGVQKDLKCTLTPVFSNSSNTKGKEGKVAGGRLALKFCGPRQIRAVTNSLFVVLAGILLPFRAVSGHQHHNQTC